MPLLAVPTRALSPTSVYTLSWWICLPEVRHMNRITQPLAFHVLFLLP